MDTRVIYNLKTGTVASASAGPAATGLEQPDRPLGDRFHRAAVLIRRWRRGVQASRSTILRRKRDTLARFDTVTATEQGLTIPVDVWTVPFGEAVDGKSSGVPMFLAVYGLAEDGRTLEYLEIPVLGVPAVDPPAEGRETRKAASARELLY